MKKQTMIDHANVLKMALVGFALQRDRIEAAMNEIQSELGQGGSSRSISTVPASAEPKRTGRRKFSSAARNRMALAQKKRWKRLKAKKAATPKRKAAAGRKKASVPASRKQRPVQGKVARKVVKAAPKVRKAVPKPKVKSAAVEAPKIVNETPAP